MSNRIANIAFSVLLITASVVFIHMAMQFENLTALAGAQVPTQMFPIAVLGILIICSTINLVKYVAPNVAEDANQPLDLDLRAVLRVVGILIILIATTQLWSMFGFLPASVFSSVAIPLVLGVRALPVLFGLTAYGPLTWMFFRHALGISL